MLYDFKPEEIGSEEFRRTVDGLLTLRPRAILAFSAGRDSIAMYHALKPFLDRIEVVWMNSGNVFPEIKEYVEKIRAQTPHFVEIVGNQPQSIKEHGYPVDVLPIDYTALGAQCTDDKPIKLRSYLDCCVENISLPLYNYYKENGVQLVFRGNRASESHKSPGKNGVVLEGIKFVSLIEPWSDDDVVKYLEDCGEEITPRLRMGHSSLDCQDCTAYTCHSFERMSYIKQYHPQTFSKLVPIFMKIDKAITKETEGLKAILDL